ncbi:DUF5691 domain-containing protein [Methylobacterium sp. Leaf466]|uniref:DUF5691 domain-containing protein n=1 Tax=Methylobacterium sp. Leaf466 TaxID=1736386 RepID=UPI0009E75B8C|nr:DUF5691 domain-containing protein [Methylobacterium sp. Leaf466]
MAHPTAGPSPGDPWRTTLAATLMGAERTPVRATAGGPLDLPATGDAGADLLAGIGGYGAYHLAGSGLTGDALRPFPPRESAGPPCPTAAADRLAGLMAENGPAERIEEWCRLAAARGFRAPPELLCVLDRRRDGATGSATIDPVAAAELAWLHRVCSGRDEPDVAADDWTVGDAGTRVTAFTALRRQDPAGARTALETAFKGEKADMRAALVRALDEGLSGADEPFLEACLDDRGSGVRTAAQILLGRSPGSRFIGRMAGRAAAALRIVETKRLLRAPRHDLVVTLPEESPELARDGIAPSPHAVHSTGGPRAQLLREIVALAPLSSYAGHPPRLWIERALASEWHEPLLAGLTEAIRRAGDPAWTQATIDVLTTACAHRLPGVTATDATRRALATVVGTLPDDQWERAMTAALAGPLDLVPTMLDEAPEAWSPAFTAALLDWLAPVAGGPVAGCDVLRRGGLPRQIAERGHADRDAAAAAAAIAARLPDDADASLRRQITAMAETLDLRAAMRREFDPT